jgi:pimeloyl-ACP methyl ester carboxylesterase
VYRTLAGARPPGLQADADGSRRAIPPLSKDITLDTWISDLVNVLEWEDLTDAIVVGHSYGGVMITGAADRVPQRIRPSGLPRLDHPQGRRERFLHPPARRRGRPPQARRVVGRSVTRGSGPFGVRDHGSDRPDDAATTGARAFARSQPGWRYVELAGGHDAMVTTPKGLLDILLSV